MDLKHAGTFAWARERLKMLVRTSVSCSAQVLSTRPGMPSGPAALRLLVLLSAAFTSGGERVRGKWFAGRVALVAPAVPGQAGRAALGHQAS